MKIAPCPQCPAPVEDTGPEVGIRPGIAFFDVDETVITAKSMFDFLEYWIDTSRRPLNYPLIAQYFADLAAQGTPREQINRAYYETFAGVSKEELELAGIGWHEAYKVRPHAYIVATSHAIRAHRRAKHMVVLVSGGFFACLDPIGRQVGADLVIGTEPVVDANGILTGEVVEPMIGDAKGAAAERVIAASGLSAQDCFGYADHRSDLRLLHAVGQAHIVGADPVLLSEADRLAWPQLPADGLPADSLAFV
jgi:HAD superfamily hydrolase (TIGR01490 family)